ncbi:MAG: putative glycoside hydrolase [Candidatus Paceibacterota bacterium]
MIEKEIQKLKNKKRAKACSRYFKTKKGEYGEGDVFLGVDVPSLRIISKKYFKEIPLKKVSELLKSNIHEYRFTALVILVEKYKVMKKKEIFSFYLKNIKGVNNWDLVDTSAPKIIGDFLQDKEKDILYDFAKSKDIWKRRIAIISTLSFISKNEFKDALKISKILLEDDNDLINKATGWVLREVGKKNKKALLDFLQKNKGKMKRTTLRYAIEKLKEKERKEWLKKGTVSIFLSFLVSMGVFGSSLFLLSEKAREERKEGAIVESIYMTGWTASSKSRTSDMLEIVKNTRINSVVIDIKDYSGYVFYKTNVPEVKAYGAEKIIIPNIEELIEKFHNEKAYVIARMVIFQDPVLARARPDIAIRRKFNPNVLWTDKSGLTWIDPSSKEAWEYNLKIAKDAFEKGFDEVNFDYIRFPSDGNLKDMDFPLWDGEKQKRAIIRDFAQYLRRGTMGKNLSVDLFGLVTVNSDDLGIGQVLEDFVPFFDYISPMVYPSHYAHGFRGYANPAEYPYEVVYYSMKRAKERIDALPYEKKAKLRPWLQDFNLGAVYDEQMVKSQIRAVYDALKEDFKGYMLWNPRNIYTRGAIKY